MYIHTVDSTFDTLLVSYVMNTLVPYKKSRASVMKGRRNSSGLLALSGCEVPTVKFGTSGSLVTKQAGWERWEEITLHKLHRLSGVSDFPAITC